MIKASKKIVFLLKSKITKSNRNKNIFLAALTSFAAKFVSILVGLITIPLTLHHLGTEKFGIWMTISSIMAFLSFSDFGIGNSLLNLVAESKSKNDITLSYKSTSSAFFLLLFFAVIILFAGSIIVYNTNWSIFFKVVNDNFEKEIKFSLFAFLVIFILNLIFSVVQKFQEGSQLGYIFSTFNIIGTFLSLFLIIFCVHFKMKLQFIILSNGLGPFIALLANLVYLIKKKIVEFKISYYYFDKEICKKLLGTGLIFIILQFFSLITNYADNIIISRVLGVSYVAKYEVVRKLFMLSFVTQFLIQPLWPAFKEAIVKNDLKWVKYTFNKSMFYCIIGSSILTLPLLFFGKVIIVKWLGNEVMPNFSILLGFYIYILISNFGGVMSTLLNSSNILKKQVPIIILVTSVTFFLKIFMARKFGINGVIWANNIAYLSIYVPLTLFLVRRHIFNNL